MSAEETATERVLRERIDELEARLARLENMTGLFANDRDLDGRRGAAKVKFDPRDWKGRSYKGAFMRDCDPDFLDLYADALSYMAAHPKPDKPAKYSDYDRLDAARARAWGRRIRNGWEAPRSSLDDGRSSFDDASAFDDTASLAATSSFDDVDTDFDNEPL